MEAGSPIAATEALAGLALAMKRCQLGGPACHWERCWGRGAPCGWPWWPRPPRARSRQAPCRGREVGVRRGLARSRGDGSCGTSPCPAAGAARGWGGRRGWGCPCPIAIGLTVSDRSEGEGSGEAGGPRMLGVGATPCPLTLALGHPLAKDALPGCVPWMPPFLDQPRPSPGSPRSPGWVWSRTPRAHPARNAGKAPARLREGIRGAEQSSSLLPWLPAGRGPVALPAPSRPRWPRAPPGSGAGLGRGGSVGARPSAAAPGPRGSEPLSWGKDCAPGRGQSPPVPPPFRGDALGSCPWRGRRPRALSHLPRAQESPKAVPREGGGQRGWQGGGCT